MKVKLTFYDLRKESVAALPIVAFGDSFMKASIDLLRSIEIAYPDFGSVFVSDVHSALSELVHHEQRYTEFKNSVHFKIVVDTALGSFSPGPWTVVGDEVSDSNECFVAGLRGEISTAHNEANGKLISQCPTMAEFIFEFADTFRKNPKLHQKNFLEELFKKAQKILSDAGCDFE